MSCSVILRSGFAISITLAYLLNVPCLHTSRYITAQLSLTRPSPALVLQATNAGVRRPGYEAMWGEHGSRSGEKTALLFHCNVIGCHCSLCCCSHFKVEIKFREHKIHVHCKSSQNSINQLVHKFVLQNKMHYRSNECETNITDVWQYSHAGEECDL